MTQAQPITRLFDFLAQSEIRLVEKHEVYSTKFSALRRSLRLIIILLRDEGDEEGGQLSDRLRALLSRWLTTPIEFDDSLLESIEAIGRGAGFETRWGANIGTAYKAACGAARALVNTTNPLREKLKELVDGLVGGGGSFRIYCHRSALVDFQFLDDPSIGTLQEGEIFLNTPLEYRMSDIFDVLVKVGPLRSRGWGAVPDAVLTAPRFNKLIQIVWAGCQDEPDFGYDPVSVSAEASLPSGFNPTGGACVMSWQTTTNQTGEDRSATDLRPDEDDFQILSKLGRPEERRPCVLVHFVGQQGALYTPRAEVLSFDPDADGSIDFRSTVDGLSRGMFLIEEPFHDSGPAGAQAEEGKYSGIWKQALVDKLLFDDRFISKIRNDGIDLVNLEQSLCHWSKPSTSVVHAPQRQKHFEILMRNLDIEYSNCEPAVSNQTRWWLAAWHEIAKTRGEAIQAGMKEHRIADGRLLEFLKARLPEIISQASVNETFYLEISSHDDLPEMILFQKIVAIEEGFLAPDCHLQTICDLEEFDQWRE